MALSPVHSIMHTPCAEIVPVWKGASLRADCFGGVILDMCCTADGCGGQSIYVFQVLGGNGCFLKDGLI